MIDLQRVCKSFDGGATWAVHDATLHVTEGETVVLLGSSGSGKTTLMKMINRLLEPTSGTITVDGVNVMQRDPVELRRSVGYVFQGIGLFPHMSVLENVALVPRLTGWSRTKRLDRARELLALVGLPPQTYASRYPRELSGGQRQRVGVARALAANPACLLMDEPFGALDAVTRDALQQETLRLKHQLNKTIVFVTHDIFEAFALGDRIAVMNHGRVEQLATREELLREPATDFVRELIGKAARQARDFREWT